MVNGNLLFPYFHWYLRNNKMKNTLKYVLIAFGFLLTGYGVYSYFKPDILMQAGPIKIEAEGDKTQPLAMVGLGILSVVAGMAFNRR